MSAGGGSARGARVSVTSHPIWRLRLVREMPRYAILATVVTGLLASARLAIWPPSARTPAVRGPQAPAVDRAAEGFAALFARRYLSWGATAGATATPAPLAEGAPGEDGLAPAAVAGGEGAPAPVAPASSEQRVEWAEVVQARRAGVGLHVYTVAAQTDTAGLLYVTVGVARAPGGGLALSGYPALVGPPATAGSAPAPRLAEVSEPALRTVVERGLRNYLAGSRGELEADLAPSARVSLPELALRLESMGRLAWTADRASVSALVRVRDARGVRYELAYELDVVHEPDRWEIAAVQMDPNA
jgi:hypothetical protein